MDNQHRKIKGYRELSQEELDLMNEIKAMGASIGILVSKLEKLSCPVHDPKVVRTSDKRWVAIGKTDLQTGLMALTRSIAKPTFF